MSTLVCKSLKVRSVTEQIIYTYLNFGVTVQYYFNIAQNNNLILYFQVGRSGYIVEFVLDYLA